MKIMKKINSNPIQCKACANFKPHNKRGNGAGICTIGVIGMAGGLWGKSFRDCDQFAEITKKV
jgi:hypothetical protein